MKKACISFPIGCGRSMLDAALLVDYFKKNGWEITSNFQEGDIVLVSTCGFNIQNENISMKFLSIADRKKRKYARLIAFGCLPGINDKRLLNEFNITLVTRRTLDRLDRIIGAEVGIRQLDEPNDLNNYTHYIKKSFRSLDNFRAKREFSREFLFNFLYRVKYGSILQCRKVFYSANTAHHSIFEGHRVFNVRTGTGCLESCSYCAIRFATGPLRSKPLNRILKEFDDGLSKGYRVFRLAAEDVGAYGQDVGSNIVELLRAVFDIKGNFKITFNDFSPRWLVQYFPELFEMFTTYRSRLGFIGIPIQSGSERILRLMRRNNTAEDARKCLVALNKASPELRINAHVMIGFPGETEEDFLDTINFLETVQLNEVATYRYSDRPNTLASKLPHKVPEKIKISREKRLLRMIESNA